MDNGFSPVAPLILSAARGGRVRCPAELASVAATASPDGTGILRTAHFKRVLQEHGVHMRTSDLNSLIDRTGARVGAFVRTDRIVGAWQLAADAAAAEAALAKARRAKEAARHAEAERRRQAWEDQRLQHGFWAATTPEGEAERGERVLGTTQVTPPEAAPALPTPLPQDAKDKRHHEEPTSKQPPGPYPGFSASGPSKPGGNAAAPSLPGLERQGRQLQEEVRWRLPVGSAAAKLVLHRSLQSQDGDRDGCVSLREVKSVLTDMNAPCSEAELGALAEAVGFEQGGGPFGQGPVVRISGVVDFFTQARRQDAASLSSASEVPVSGHGIPEFTSSGAWRWLQAMGGVGGEACGEPPAPRRLSHTTQGTADAGVWAAGALRAAAALPRAGSTPSTAAFAQHDSVRSASANKRLAILAQKHSAFARRAPRGAEVLHDLGASHRGRGGGRFGDETWLTFKAQWEAKHGAPAAREAALTAAVRQETARAAQVDPTQVPAAPFKAFQVLHLATRPPGASPIRT